MEQNIHMSMCTDMPVMSTTIITDLDTDMNIRITMSITTAEGGRADTSPG